MQTPLLVLVSAALGVLLAAACTDDQAPLDAGPSVAVTSVKPGPTTPVLPPLVGTPPADPAAAIAKMLPGSSGWCVQVRSVPTRLEADRIAADIRAKLSLPVTLIEVDLGERGTWWRLCAGEEPSEGAADDKGRQWTAAKGALRPFMADVVPGQAAYQVLELPRQSQQAASAELALALLRARPDDDRRPVLLRSGGQAFGAVTLPPDAVGQTDVAVIARDGRVLSYAVAKAPPGCESCRAALSHGTPSRRLLSAGDVVNAPGAELLVEERSGDDDAVLSVFAIEGGALVRVAWFLLGTSTANLRVLGDARALDADGEPGDELALIRLELPIVENRLCALRERVEVLDLRRSPPRKLDVTWASTMAVAEESGGAQPTKRLIAALDQLGDEEAATRVCAAYLKTGRDATLASLCIARVGELLERGRLVAAVNAAGLLSEAAEALRPVVAGPFYRAASGLDDDPRLAVASGDCVSAPLIADVQGKRLEHLVKLARVRAKERVLLADLLPEVFLTGARDFGAAAPVGQLTASWLARLKEQLPARAATVEARLSALPEGSGGAATPPSNAPRAVSTGTPPSPAPAAKPGGYIHIEVHDEEGAGGADDDDSTFGNRGEESP